MSEQALREFQQLLPIRKHRLDDELEMQGEILYRIGEHRARANKAMLEAKSELAFIEAEISAKARNRMQKVTVGELAGITLMDPQHRSANSEYLAMCERYDRWDALYEAWRSRGFALKTLGELYISSYYTSDSIGSKREKQEQEHSNNRRAIAAARNQPARHRRTIQD